MVTSQARPERAARRVEGPGLLPKLHESVLHGLLRQLTPPQHTLGDAEHQRRIVVVDGAERAAVALGATPEKAGVIQDGAAAPDRLGVPWCLRSSHDPIPFTRLLLK